VPPKRNRIAPISAELAAHVTAEQALDELAWQRFFRDETAKLLQVFYGLNAGVFLLVFILWLAETFCPLANNRVPVITERVVLALIAASAAQLGALAFAAVLALIKRMGR
jgi:hypothetical protein